MSLILHLINSEQKNCETGGETTQWFMTWHYIENRIVGD
jgi:hypothetical protein